MNKKWILVLLIVFPCCLFAEEPIDQVDRDQLSITLGHLFVRGLNQTGFEFNLEKVVEGIRNEKEGKASPMSEEEYEQIVFMIQEQQFEQQAALNLQEANDFLEKNAAKEDVHTLDAQLHYTISQEGTGENEVGPESIPLIHYTGKLIDGTVFASSEETQEPVALPMQQTIPGFAKGVTGMKEGEKRTLYIHPELTEGLFAQLPPNTLLIFEVEVVKAHALSDEEKPGEIQAEPSAS